MQYGRKTVAGERPRTGGKFLFLGDEKLYVRGVTYGTFGDAETDDDYPAPEVVARDFAAMAANDINAVRVYTVPPRWLLDLAWDHGLHVLVGIAWEQHVAVLDDRRRIRSIEERVREAVRTCASHPAVLCYTIGNEIPSSIVRWHGRRRIERFLERLYRIAKAEDPEGLVAYVNYPSTEYLQLPFVDLVCFNVYLEEDEQLEAYIARLQNLAGDRPLVLTELGLDSRRNGELAQAVALGWQVRTAFAAGCAGAIVFAWTDEWWRGSDAVLDWEFGVTDRERRPRPALGALRDAFAEAPVRRDLEWPRTSVIVCSYNGAATIEACLAGVTTLAYPSYEVIVVDDGSTDETAAIAKRFPVRVIETENRGLSAARNTGLAAATGDVVAYIDDDCVPDPDWLTYLALSFMSTPHGAVGGPNVPPHDGAVAECVARAPGGPTHVLVSDREAEHIPGCNMAFRKAVLDQLGGFDPRFRIAGDDVDICWRLQDAGWTIGFSPAAMVWHRRRSSVRAYLQQQKGYGAAEGLLEQKWPERYNLGGHPRWNGRVYGGSAHHVRTGPRWRIYYGTWGSGLFQSVYRPAPSLLGSLPLMPEWYLAIAALSVLTGLGLARPSLAFELPGTPIPVFAILLGFAVATTVAQAVGAAWHAFPQFTGRASELIRLRLLTAVLHVMQPLVRLAGRMRHGLTPWRRRQPTFAHAPPWPSTRTLWMEEWQHPDKTLLEIESKLRRSGGVVVRGDAFERWDLEARMGNFGAVRVQMAVEEHGRGTQLLRFRLWPRWSRFGVVAALALAGVAAYGGAVHNVAAALLFGVPAAWVAIRIVGECAAATAALHDAFAVRRAEPQQPLVEALPTRVAVMAHRPRHALDSAPVAELVE
jgi:GT2 family glycosyltransferase